jgi:hypothetical protein
MCCLTPETDAPHSAAADVTMHYVSAEKHLRAAGRGLERVGVFDPQGARLAGICFRLAHRVVVDSGRLEAAA